MRLDSLWSGRVVVVIVVGGISSLRDNDGIVRVCSLKGLAVRLKALL